MPADEEPDGGEPNGAMGNGHDTDGAEHQPQPAATFAPAEDAGADEEEDQPAMAEPPAVEDEPAGPPRRGWWQRR
jgi:hypothetical protein